jgi:6-phosphogluconolactonase (cycloisomerase 2 family)
MRREPSRLAFVAMSLVCVFILGACNCAPTLRYITISPSNQTIAVGTTQQFTATGYYSNGAVTPGISVSWSSSTTSVATINGTSGVATGVAVGTTTITATALGITSGTTTLTVNQLTAITITPLNQTITVSGTEQYDALGTFLNPGGTTTTSDITAQVTWTSSATAVATFSTTTPGLATGVAAGTTMITASLDGVTSASTNLTVGVAITLAITPSANPIAVGNSVSFTAVETSGTATNPPKYPVTWTSSTMNVANVIASGTNGAALGAGFAAGTTTITATEAAPTPLVATLTLTVTTGTQHYAYTPNITDATISVYTVNATTSPYLTADGSPVNGSPTLPKGLILNPNGSYMYIIGQNGYLTIFDVKSGIPSYPGIPGVGGGQVNRDYGVIDPYGRFLYVVDSGSGSGTHPNGAIFAFTISQTDGNPTAVTGSPFTANVDTSLCLVIDHSGQYLYATNSGNNTVSAYQIDQSTGALTPLSTGATIATGGGPEFATLDPTGTYLYTANNNGASVSSYSIGAGGVLTSLGPDTAVTGAGNVLNVAVTPNGSYLYVLDGGNSAATPAVAGAVYGFTLSSGVPSTTLITGTPLPTGISPTTIAIDPSGSLMMVNNQGSSTISLFTIGSGGTLTSDTPVATGIGPTFLYLLNAP